MEDEHEKLAEERIGRFNNEGREDVEELKQAARDFVYAVSKHCPQGRRKAEALTCIETGAMFAVKSLFDG